MIKGYTAFKYAIDQYSTDNIHLLPKVYGYDKGSRSGRDLNGPYAIVGVISGKYGAVTADGSGLDVVGCRCVITYPSDRFDYDNQILSVVEGVIQYITNLSSRRIDATPLLNTLSVFITEEQFNIIVRIEVNMEEL